MNKFKEGDIVRLKRGQKPLKVVCVYKFGGQAYEYDLQYIHSGALRFYENESNITHYDIQPEQQKEEDMAQLYEIPTVAGVTYGIKLAVNSEKKWVMEEKGTGAILVADPATVKKVMPYTIGVKFGNESQEYPYLAEKGKYEKGQTFLVTSNAGNYQIAVVHRVDTENEKATKDFAPVARILTESV